jgi:hypothetical protein
MDQVDGLLGQLLTRIKALEQRMDAKDRQTEELVRKVGQLKTIAEAQNRK